MLKAVFTNYQKNSDGIWLNCHIPEGEIKSNLLDSVMHGSLTIDDGRRISAEQRKKIYAMCRDISDYTGHDVEDLKENILKINFMMKEQRDYFSLANVDMTTARYFIEFILEFCFEFDVPLACDTQKLAREVNNYLYLCLIYRKCAICGKSADIHHVDAVGIGRDRAIIDHPKHRLVALCREHHNEVHTIGWVTFKTKYVVDGIKVNQETIKKLGL